MNNLKTISMTAVEWLAEQMMHPQIFNPYIEQALEMEKHQIENAYDHLKSVTRFEVIDHTSDAKGRCYVAKDCQIEMSLQDDNKTLKIFVTDSKLNTMDYDIVKTEKYLLVVKDNEIKSGDYTLWENEFVERVQEVKDDYFVTDGGVRNPALKTSKKIIAHLPLNDAILLENVDILSFTKI